MVKRYRTNQLARIETMARSLARSGKYRSYVEIRNLLEVRGFDQTPRVFENRWSQTEIDRLCYQARAVVAAA
jgi:hypothetical protein